jgi:hypothetical protein
MRKMHLIIGVTVSMAANVVPVCAQMNRVNPSIPFTGGDATHISPPYEPAVPPDSVAMPAVERARYTLNAYASCLVHLNRKGVEATLKIPVGTKASDDAEVKLSVDDCMGTGELKMDGSLLRGALYRALYRTDFWRNPPTLSAEGLDYARDMGPGLDTSQYVALRQYGECIVRADPADARNVMLSATATATEHDALLRLSPTFSTCLAKGSQIKFSKPTLLGLLAEVMYRLSQPSPVPGTRAGG